MNGISPSETGMLSQKQRRQFSQMLDKLYQCCTDRQVYISGQFGIPQAELRCLLLFGQERYLTAKGIAARLNIVRSRVTMLVNGLTTRGLVSRIPDPADSRVVLLALTPAGQKVRQEVSGMMESLRDKVLDAVEPERRPALLQSLETLKTAMERAGENLE
ncbi:MAG: MarR family winged helix-turn-helix transcriptional regulator [Humidesulfovibrio sp.]|nr:MarR family winged helix-turn-helix transcriptional regulator [Humidesulfovibrio sp.]